MYPTGKVSAIQEAQMTTINALNVNCLSVDGTFDDCQDFVKALFTDPMVNATQKLAAGNSGAPSSPYTNADSTFICFNQLGENPGTNNLLLRVILCADPSRHL